MRRLGALIALVASALVAVVAIAVPASRQASAATAGLSSNSGSGYWMLGATGTVYPFGSASPLGSATNLSSAAAIAPTPDGGGYWVVSPIGAVDAFGDAANLNSLGRSNSFAVSIASTLDGKGYWVATQSGQILTYGDAVDYGSPAEQGLTLAGPIVNMVATVDGKGYWMLGSDGGVFTYGDATFYGSTGSTHLNAPAVAMAPTSDGAGYWFVASDGGVFSFGDVSYYGSMGGKPLDKPVIGMVVTSDGGGYWLDASDGGVFTFGDAGFVGSLGGTSLPAPIVGFAAVPMGSGGTTTTTTSAPGSTTTSTSPSGPSTVFYVAQNGNDSWSGNFATSNPGNSDGPFATLQRAQQAVESERQSQTTGSITVEVENGTYTLGQPLSFGAADSGSPSLSITWKAYPGATPVISGGARIQGWTNTSGNTWTVSLDAATTADFEGLFYNGVRRYRPTSSPGGYLYNAGPYLTDSPGTNCALVQGSQSQYECFDRFYYSGNDIASSYHDMGIGDVEVLDFQKWIMSRMRLASVDTTDHLAYVTGPTGENSTNDGFIAGHAYIIENTLENLSAPGQWYLDRCPGEVSCTIPAATWTLTYLANPGEDPNTDSVMVPQVDQLLVADGLQYVTFQGLNFSYANWVPPAPGFADQQGIPGVPAAVSFTDSSNVSFTSDTVDHVEGWGVEFVSDDTGSAPSNDSVSSSLFSDLGAGGIRIGTTQKKTDSASNVPQFDTVTDNTVDGGGRVQPTGGGSIFVGAAHDITVSHNTVTDLYETGIGVCVPTPNGCPYDSDITVSDNLVYGIGQGVMSDMGGIYMATYADPGNTITGNVVHDVDANIQDPYGYGGHGIYLDNTTSNVTVSDDLVYRTSYSSVFVNGGSGNQISNNVLAFGLGGEIERNPAPGSLSFDFTHNLVYFDKAEPQYGTLWPCTDAGGNADSCTNNFLFDSNDYFDTTGAPLKFVTSSKFLTEAQWQGLGEDVNSIDANPIFVNPSAGDFELQAGSPAGSIGYQSVDWSGAGAPSSVSVVVPAAFPTSTLSPSQY